MSEPILGVLRRLREDARAQSAPEALEEELLAVFREYHAARHSDTRKWLWASAAIAAFILAGFTWRFSWSRSMQAPQNRPEPVAVVPQHVAPKPAGPVAKATPKPKVRKQQKQNRPQVASAPRAEEREFIRLPYAPAFDPYDGGQVVRVSMPGASVRNLGLPVVMERVQADVLLGGDGVARAIRLVSSSGLNSEGR
jgi:hypothetical protein